MLMTAVLTGNACMVGAAALLPLQPAAASAIPVKRKTTSIRFKPLPLVRTLLKCFLGAVYTRLPRHNRTQHSSYNSGTVFGVRTDTRGVRQQKRFRSFSRTKRPHTLTQNIARGGRVFGIGPERFTKAVEPVNSAASKRARGRAASARQALPDQEFRPPERAREPDTGRFDTALAS